MRTSANRTERAPQLPSSFCDAQSSGGARRRALLPRGLRGGAEDVSRDPPTTKRPPAPASPCSKPRAKGTLVASTPRKIANDEITELPASSSHRTNGVWWVNNDSGDNARLFAVGHNGRSLGEFHLAGATATDWEDIGIGPGPKAGVAYLYAADIGDNAEKRPSVQLYRVPNRPSTPRSPRRPRRRSTASTRSPSGIPTARTTPKRSSWTRRQAGSISFRRSSAPRACTAAGRARGRIDDQTAISRHRRRRSSRDRGRHHRSGTRSLCVPTGVSASCPHRRYDGEAKALSSGRAKRSASPRRSRLRDRERRHPPAAPPVRGTVTRSDDVDSTTAWE